jgi:hypothetical protein
MKHTLKKIHKSLVTFSIAVLLFSYTFAGNLSLLKIGTLDTGGKTYPEWWYKGASPVLSGMASVGTDVTIRIGETSVTSTPDASGAWTYATNLENGDYVIQITQEPDTISFTLHLGQDMNAGATTQPSTTQPGDPVVPDTGFNQYVAASFGMGIILLSTYFYFSTDNKKKTVFESRVLKED